MPAGNPDGEPDDIPGIARDLAHDRDLVEAIRRNPRDEAAWEGFLAAHGDWIRIAIRRIAAGFRRNGWTADFYCSFVLKLAEGAMKGTGPLHNWDGERPLRSYLHAVILRHTYAEIKGLGPSEGTLEDEDRGAPIGAGPQEPAGPRGDLGLSDEQRRRLRREIESVLHQMESRGAISFRNLLMFKLRYFEEIPSKQVVELLGRAFPGLTVSALDKAMHDVRGAVREHPEARKLFDWI